MKLAFIVPRLDERHEGATNPPLAFAVLAGLTPKDNTIVLYDENIVDLPDPLDADIACISISLFTSRRGYEICKMAREQGITTIVGGYHATFLPEEAGRYADCVVIGQAEYVWSQVLADYAAGKLASRYGTIASGPYDIRNTVYDMDIFKGINYKIPLSVETTRGCRYNCEYCSVCSFNDHKHKSRTPDQIIEQLANSHEKIAFFIDDNFLTERASAYEILERMIPLNLRWSTQISIDVVEDEKMLSLIQRSGGVTVLIGFETLNVENLKLMRKAPNIRIQDYGKAIKKIKSYGLEIIASFIIGYDYDTVDTIPEIEAFCRENPFASVLYHSMLPIPGTALYARIREEGRLLREEAWLEKDFGYGSVIFRPMRMTPEELHAGVMEANRKSFAARR